MTNIKEEFELSEYLIWDEVLQEYVIMTKKIKEFIRLLKENPRFKQTGQELRNELNLENAEQVQKIQLMFTEILLDIENKAGEKLCQ